MEKAHKTSIYILHEYDIKSHFSALYSSKNNDVLIKDYIVLSKIFLLKRFIKSILKKGSVFKSFKELVISIMKIHRLKNLNDEILIVGIAPYNNLMKKYEKVFQKNKCIYFTSWTDWSGNNFPNGKYENKVTYEKILKECFYAAACVTNKTEYQIKNYINNTSVVNHSIETNNYIKKNLKEYSINKKKKLIYLGQLIERKNIKIILKWIESSACDYEFSFAGDGELKDEILELTKRNNKIKYLGNISKEQIKNTLNEYDFLILPSKNELFGIVLIEALACGVPCIVSDCDGPKEIIIDNYNGFVFNNNDFDDFCEKMNKIVNLNKEEYIRLSKNSVNSSEKYDTKAILKKWKILIDNKN